GLAGILRDVQWAVECDHYRVFGDLRHERRRKVLVRRGCPLEGTVERLAAGYPFLSRQEPAGNRALVLDVPGPLPIDSGIGIGSRGAQIAQTAGPLRESLYRLALVRDLCLHAHHVHLFDTECLAGNRVAVRELEGDRAIALKRPGYAGYVETFVQFLFEVLVVTEKRKWKTQFRSSGRIDQIQVVAFVVFEFLQHPGFG